MKDKLTSVPFIIAGLYFVVAAYGGSKDAALWALGCGIMAGWLLNSRIKGENK